MNYNILLQTDSYKASHFKAYPQNLQKIYSYLEARGGIHNEIIFFGLQYYLKKYLCGQQVTSEKINEAEAFWTAHFGRTDCFNREGWEYILTQHDGFLPLEIKAVPEGTKVNIQNVLITIVNTDDKCFWLVNYVETLLMKVWYTISQSTRSYYIRQDILKHLELSGSPELIDFKCHDFGYRGVTSEEHGALGTASHLLSFMGTDGPNGIQLLQEYYSADMCGFSIPATEHSVACSFGRDNEIQACENFLDVFPTGTIAFVSDTYDIYNSCENIWGGVLKDKVINRDGCLVVRPDSGNMFDVVPKCLDILWNKFGGITNDKGYKVLDSHIRLIQGDGVNPETANKLYEHIISLGWSADNLAVGSGGGLLVKGLDRDTYKFAIKASAAMINNNWIGLQKDPITDQGKKSKIGRLKLVKDNDQYKTVSSFDLNFDTFEDELVIVFKDGQILVDQTLTEVKSRLIS